METNDKQAQNPFQNQFQQTAEEAAAFQRIWAESATRIMQAACTNGLSSPPPEILKQIRSGIFQALAESWDEFMRTPQFLESMRQWMENAITFRKMTNDFMAKVRNEMQAPSRDDMDTIMLNIRHMEKRLLDRVEELSAQIQALKPAAPKASAKTAARKPAAGRRTGKTRVAKVNV
jgi:hypothetical protein